jgi:NAD(P) transhydrogenase subunit alpha
VLLVLLFNLGVSPVGGRSAQAQTALPAGSQTEASESVGLTESERATPAHPRVDRRETLLASLTIFVLAIFLGFELITKVPPTLHTPLMSGSNAISGITVVGAILATGVTTGSWAVALWGALAIILATINVFGGFAVTHRMLAMFRRK